MGQRIVRKASRLFERELKNRFDNDLNREISELITNSIDSYGRLVNSGLHNSDEQRKVIVRLAKPQRKNYEKHTIQVIDFAEGMSRNTLLDIFGEKGANNNQGLENDNVRGLFGLGASDCMNASLIENKSAEYWSIKDGEVTNLRFKLSDSKNEVEIIDSQITNEKQIRGIREKYGISKNGTVAIFGIPDAVEVKPSFEEFKHSLESMYLLRNLLSDDLNNVVLEAYGKSERLSSKEYILTNHFYESNDIQFIFKNKEFKGSIKFYKNENKNQNPTHILVQDDRGNLYDNQLFGFAKAQGNEVLSGILTLENFWETLNYFLELRVDLIKDDRTGFDTSKKFGKALVEAISKPITEALSIIIKEQGRESVSLEKTKNYSDFLKLLNKDLNSNQKAINGRFKEPPASGIEFARSIASITAGHNYDLKLYVNKEIVKQGSEIEIHATGNNGNISFTKEIRLTPDDYLQDIVVKSCAISAISKTEIPIELFARVNNLTSSCLINVIEENIIYPQNGIEFERPEVTLTPDVTHKKIRLYFDLNVLSENENVSFTNNSNGKLIIADEQISLSGGKKVTDNIGYIELELKGGDLKEQYLVTAKTVTFSDELDVYISSSKYQKPGSDGDISDYEIDPSGYYDVRSYYDITDKKVKIVQGNPINDVFIKHYNSAVGGKDLRYIISLVCFEAAKLYANKEKANGHIDYGDFDGYQNIVELKQKEYFEKYLELEKNTNQ